MINFCRTKLRPRECQRKLWQSRIDLNVEIIRLIPISIAAPTSCNSSQLCFTGELERRDRLSNLSDQDQCRMPSPTNVICMRSSSVRAYSYLFALTCVSNLRPLHGKLMRVVDRASTQ